MVVTGLSGIPLAPLAMDDKISATDIRKSADSLLLAVVVQYMLIKLPSYLSREDTFQRDHLASVNNAGETLVVFTVWHQAKV